MPDDFEDRPSSRYRDYADGERPVPSRRARDGYDDRPVKRRRRHGGYYRPDEDEKNSAMLCHLLAIFTGFIGPIILWTSKKEDSRFVDYHGREALNFALNILIYSLSAVAILTIIAVVTCGIGAVLIPLVFAVNIYALVMHIIALNAAKRGEWYRYPMTFRMIGPPEGMEALPPAGEPGDAAARGPDEAGGDYADDRGDLAPSAKGSLLWLWITGGVCLLLLGGCTVGGIVFAVFQSRSAATKAVARSSIPAKAANDPFQPFEPIQPADPFKPVDPIKPPDPFRPGIPVAPADPALGLETIDGALKGLQSTDLFERGRAADSLSRMEPSAARRAEVVKALRKQLQDADRFPRDAAVRALVVWATTKDDVPLLLEMMPTAGFGERAKIIATLGKLKDKRASAALAEALKDIGSYRAAAEALKQIGPAAENDVLAMLPDAKTFARRAALDVLKEIGTKKSLPMLETLSKDRSIATSRPAKDAADAIKARNP